MKVVIQDFDGGIVNDARSHLTNVCRICTNFDVLTDKHKLSPYRAVETGDASASTNQIKNFTIGSDNGSTPAYRLYGLGISSNQIDIFYKALTTGATNDLDDSGWSSGSGGNKSVSAPRDYEFFTWYEKVGLLFGVHAGTHIWTYEPNGDTFTNESQALTYTSASNGIVHSKDDVLYVGYYYNGGGTPANIVSAIASKNGTAAWSTTALALPKHLRVTNICEYGDYLAIACAPTSGQGNSVVFLWDRDSTNTLLAARIDWGEGVLKIIEEVNGELIGISSSGRGVADTSNISRFQNRIIFKSYSTSYGANPIALLLSSTTGSTQLPYAKQKIDNRLYFMGLMYLNGTQREGIWSIGRPATGSPYSIIHEHTPNNDTASTSPTMHGFYIVGDYVFSSYTSSAAVAMTKTDDSPNSNITSIYETSINPKMDLEDRGRNKQLMAVSLSFEPVTDGDQVVLAYRVDSTSSYTTLRTYDTANGVNFEMNDANGTQFTSGREYEFRIESQGVVVTELKYEYTIIETLI